MPFYSVERLSDGKMFSGNAPTPQARCGATAFRFWTEEEPDGYLYITAFFRVNDKIEKETYRVKEMNFKYS